MQLSTDFHQGANFVDRYFLKGLLMRYFLQGLFKLLGVTREVHCVSTGVWVARSGHK